MTKQENRRGGVSKLARTETVTVRLDSKLRYLADIAARVQRRTLSSFIEWAVQASLDKVRFGDSAERDRSVADESERLWDVDEPDRFARLALHYPNLLTYEEQVLWKEIRETEFFWEGDFTNDGWGYEIKEENLDLKALRRDWDRIVAVANGDHMKLEEWFLRKRMSYRDFGGCVHENNEGYYLQDDEGTVLVDRNGHVHISPQAIEDAELHGKRVLLKVKKEQGSAHLTEDGAVYMDKEGDVYEVRKGARLAAKIEDGEDLEE